MVFNSFVFIIFLLVTAAVYLGVPARFRKHVLLFSSCFFYGYWSWKYFILLLFSTTVVFVTSQLLGRTENLGRRRLIVFCCMFIDCGLLFVFKYVDFFATSFVAVLNALTIKSDWTPWALLIPVGISFYTFQSIGYVLDVYHRKTPIIKNYIDYLNFILFFPQLVAGPISEAGQLAPQLVSPGKMRAVYWKEAFEWLLWGYFLKVVVADNLAFHVNQFFPNAAQYEGLSALLGVYCFNFQVYCDFAGYSTIAVGLAKLFGIDVIQNFREPLVATSVSDFWRRWHVSLTVWIRDHIYIPLGGSRNGFKFFIISLLCGWIFSGLWHGAAWRFVIWGLLNASFIVIEKLLLKWKKFQHVVHLVPGINFMKFLICFNLFAASNIFFRAQSMDEARSVIASIFSPWTAGQISSLIKTNMFFQLLLYGGAVLLLEFYRRRRKSDLPLSFVSDPAKAVIYAGLIVFIICFGVSNGQEFLYFRL